MRGESHRQLGHYLVRRYLDEVPPHHVRAFLIGCIQPDRNPTTYLKGSVRHQWLRGHNYRNARRFVDRTARRLVQKKKWSTLDYYTLGKLIHYTADAFTYAHNDWFPAALKNHREYEQKLQTHFLQYLQEAPEIEPRYSGNIIFVISCYHREYRTMPHTVHTDSYYALAACSNVMHSICKATSKSII